MSARKKKPKPPPWLGLSVDITTATHEPVSPEIVAAALHDTLLDLRRASPEAFAALIDLLVRDGLVRYPLAFLP